MSTKDNRKTNIRDVITQELEIGCNRAEAVSNARSLLRRVSSGSNRLLPGVNLVRESMSSRELDYAESLEEILSLYEELRIEHEHLLQRYELVAQSSVVGLEQVMVVDVRMARSFMSANGWIRDDGVWSRRGTSVVMSLDRWPDLRHRLMVVEVLSGVHNLTPVDVWVEMVLDSSKGTRLGSFDVQQMR
jgi:hypothetical protein